VFESRLLSRLLSKICGSKRESYKTGKNDMTKFMICIPKTNIICVIRSRRIRRAGHVARMGGEEKWIQSLGGETRTRLKCMSFLSLHLCRKLKRPENLYWAKKNVFYLQLQLLPENTFCTIHRYIY